MPTRLLTSDEANYINEWQSILNNLINQYRNNPKGLQQELKNKDFKADLQVYLNWLKELPNEFPELERLSNLMETRFNMLRINPKQETIDDLLTRDFVQIQKLASKTSPDPIKIPRNVAIDSGKNVSAVKTSPNANANANAENVNVVEENFEIPQTRIRRDALTQKPNVTAGVKSGEQRTSLHTTKTSVHEARIIDTKPIPKADITRKSAHFQFSEPAKLSPTTESVSVPTEKVRVPTKFDQVFEELLTSEKSYHDGLNKFNSAENQKKYRTVFAEDITNTIFESIRTNIAASNHFYNSLQTIKKNYDKSPKNAADIATALEKLNELYKNNYQKMTGGHLKARQSSELLAQANKTKYERYKEKNPGFLSTFRYVFYSVLPNPLVKILNSDFYNHFYNPVYNPLNPPYIANMYNKINGVEKGGDPTINLASTIIKPIQRGPRHELLTKELLKATEGLETEINPAEKSALIKSRQHFAEEGFEFIKHNNNMLNKNSLNETRVETPVAKPAMDTQQTREFSKQLSKVENISGDLRATQDNNVEQMPAIRLSQSSTAQDATKAGLQKKEPQPVHWKIDRGVNGDEIKESKETKDAPSSTEVEQPEDSDRPKPSR